MIFVSSGSVSPKVAWGERVLRTIHFFTVAPETLVLFLCWLAGGDGSELTGWGNGAGGEGDTSRLASSGEVRRSIHKTTLVLPLPRAHRA